MHFSVLDIDIAILEDKLDVIIDSGTNREKLIIKFEKDLTNLA